MTRYAVDLDGVLAQTVEASLEEFNRQYGTNYDKWFVTRWDWYELFPEIQNLPKSKRKDIMFRTMSKVWNEGRVRPEPGAAEFMRELGKRARVDIVTGRSGDVSDETLATWLAEHDIRYDNLVRAKGDKMFAGNYDVYVDDNPGIAEDVQKFPRRKVFLYDQPWNWNLDVPATKNVKRIHRLEEAVPPRFKQETLFRRPGVRVRSHVRRA